MAFDIASLAVTGLFLVLGILSGFLKQVVRIVALVGAFLLLSPLTNWIRGNLSGTIDVETFPGSLLTMGLAWLLGYLLILLAGMILVRILRGSSRTLSILDRILGGALGALKGALVAYFLICVLLLFEDPLREHVPELPRQLEASRVARFVRDHNVLKGLNFSWEDTSLPAPVVDRLKKI